MKNYWRGVFLVLGAAVFWGMTSPLAKVLTMGGISLMSAMVYRALFVVITLGPWLLITRGPEAFRVSRELYAYYFMSGILSVVLSGGGFLMSLETLTVSEALIIHYTFPLVTLAGSRYVTREKPLLREILAGAMILVGVYMGMLGGGKSIGNVSVAGVVWGVLAVVGISGQALLVRRFSKGQKTDQMALLFFAHLSGFAALFIGKSLFMGWNDLANLTLPLFLVANFQSLSASLIAFGLFYTALKYIPAGTVSLLCSLEMVVGVVLSAIFLGLIPTWHEAAGCVIILVSIALASIRKAPEGGEKAA